MGTAHADTFGSGANTFDIEFVPIGNPGNPEDTSVFPLAGGKVDYSYRMGKYEISEDMIDHANASGGLGITYFDFTGMDKPATGITWFEAARFVNWLNTSKGHTPAYKFNGDTFEFWQSSDAGYTPFKRIRNSQAFYFLPDADEWHKAAYYDPTAGVYYDYPTGSDSVPDGIDFPGDPTFEAVFKDCQCALTNPEPKDITNVGVLSPYGTAGQGGNVFEWEETFNASSPSRRHRRGGDWHNTFESLRSSSAGAIVPTSDYAGLGFRVATIIPEPSSLLLGALASVGVLMRGRRLG